MSTFIHCSMIGVVPLYPQIWKIIQSAFVSGVLNHHDIKVLSADTIRVFPVEVFLSRDVAPVSAICIVSSTSYNCSSSFCWCFACSLPTGWYCLADGPDKRDRFADVATGNSIIDGTKGFVQALVVCYTGSGFLFKLFLSSLLFVLVVWYLPPLVPRWL